MCGNISSTAGAELAKAIKAEHPDIPIILFSALEPTGKQSVHFDATVLKGSRPKEFHDAIERVLS